MHQSEHSPIMKVMIVMTMYIVSSLKYPYCATMQNVLKCCSVINLQMFLKLSYMLHLRCIFCYTQ